MFLVACGPNVSSPEDNGFGPDGGDKNDNSNNNGTNTDPDNPDPIVPCTKMDIVFVVDDSYSMTEEQNNLGANFPLFFDIIDNYVVETGEPLDYRIAVTTSGRDVDYTIKLPPPFDTNLPQSEKGDNGELRQNCGMTRRWLERGDEGIKETFECLANVGVEGPSLEMPLYTTQLAFTDRVADGTNDGFRRPEALLATVVLTDEDDCSRTDNNFEIESDQCDPSDTDTYVPVETFANWFDSYTGHRGRWATAVIAGEESCTSNFGDAIKAERLQNFVNVTGDNAVFSSICEGDLASALHVALDTFEAACEKFPPVD
jgi:hypothetical protein